MHEITPLPAVRRTSGLWHLFWLLLIGMIGGAGIVFTDVISTFECSDHCAPARYLSDDTALIIIIAGWPIAAWLAAFIYDMRWGHRRSTFVSGVRVLAAPPLYFLALGTWEDILPVRDLRHAPVALAILLLGVPFVALLLLTHLDLLLRPPPAR